MDFSIRINNIQLLQFLTSVISEFNAKIIFLPNQKIIKCLIYVGNMNDINHPYMILNINVSDKNIKSFEDIINSKLRSLKSFRFDIDNLYLFMKKIDKNDYEEIAVNDSLKINLITRDMEFLYNEIMNTTQYLKIFIKDISSDNDILYQA